MASTPSLVADYIAALNSGDVAAVTKLYQPSAGHVTGKRTVVGANDIAKYYYDLLGSVLRGATFTLVSSEGEDTSRRFKWTAAGPTSTVTDGDDTMGLRDGLIQYHYTYYNVRPRAESPRDQVPSTSQDKASRSAVVEAGQGPVAFKRRIEALAPQSDLQPPSPVDADIAASGGPSSNASEAPPPPTAASDQEAEHSASAAAPRYTHFLASDQPSGDDHLGYDEYASALAQIISSPITQPPLTIGVYGEWGLGKSFLLRRIKTQVAAIQSRREHARNARSIGSKLRDWILSWRPLRQSNVQPQASDTETQRKSAAHLWHWIRQKFALTFTRTPSSDMEFVFIDFNAWAYSGSENLWAGLITQLYSQVEKHLGWQRTLFLRLGQNAKEAAIRTVSLIAFYLIVIIGIMFVVGAQLNQSNVGIVSPQGLISALFALLLGSSAIAAALPSFVKSWQELASSFTSRSQQLAALASRPNFRDKIGFMAEIKSEIQVVRRLLAKGRGGLQTRPIILIDDLDRCPPVKAVEVLEAIMLLLADEDGAPFIVLLAVDVRAIVRAVAERYGVGASEGGILGYEFLDKIVQIPFFIPHPGSREIQEYVESLINRSVVHAGSQSVSVSSSGPATSGEPAQDGGRLAGSASTATRRVAIQPQLASEEVEFTPDESESFRRLALAGYLSANPRRLKRIVNVYRMLRMLAGETDAIGREKLIRWVILTELWPCRAAALLGQRRSGDWVSSGEDGTPLRDVFEPIDIALQGSMVAEQLDIDPALLRDFAALEPILTTADMQRMQRITFNVNPSLTQSRPR